MNPSIKETLKDQLLTTFNEYSDDVCNSEEREELGMDDYKWEGDEIILSKICYEGLVHFFKLSIEPKGASVIGGWGEGNLKKEKVGVSIKDKR